MPFEVSWFTPDRVILVKAIGVIAVHELEKLDQDTIRMFDQSTQDKVHYIYDPSAQTAPPPLKNLLGMKTFKHPKLGWAMYVQKSNKLVGFASTVMAQVFKLNLKMVNSMADAEAFARTLDTVRQA